MAGYRLTPKMQRSFGKGGDAGNPTLEFSEKINFLAQD
jgi:hypothetical protein